jgi:hypothetical protein
MKSEWTYWNTILNIENGKYEWNSVFEVFEDGNIVQIDLEE